ncbi:hypothetical protein [Dysgonomonas sp. 520]|uniref:hypothetical protein n=1 Tax=Dysgonomonas sp. 520 TaxID=2302931 RepID=UPI0013D483F0|nr:hypothetical protein [Dysgonomonas sp. 520]NDW08468.1 hypothetical protein [Dysgonomonas sp. 520]
MKKLEKDKLNKELETLSKEELEWEIDGMYELVNEFDTRRGEYYTEEEYQEEYPQIIEELNIMINLVNKLY